LGNKRIEKPLRPNGIGFIGGTELDVKEYSLYRETHGYSLELYFGIKNNK
jgi:hypothetical protein